MRDLTLERFVQELDDLIEKWSNSPLDDRLTVSAVVGALHIKMHAISANALAESEEDDYDFPEADPDDRGQQ